MRGKLIGVFITGALMCAATAASAHHSFPATYQVSKIVTIEGKVAQLLFRNPHSFLQLDVTDASGQTTRWSLEWAAAGQLVNQGVVKDTLKAGDLIIVTANPARSTSDSTRALLKSIKRPADGWTWGAAPGQVVD